MRNHRGNGNQHTRTRQLSKKISKGAAHTLTYGVTSERLRSFLLSMREENVPRMINEAKQIAKTEPVHMRNVQANNEILIMSDDKLTELRHETDDRFKKCHNDIKIPKINETRNIGREQKSKEVTKITGQQNSAINIISNEKETTTKEEENNQVIEILAINRAQDYKEVGKSTGKIVTLKLTSVVHRTT